MRGHDGCVWPDAAQRVLEHGPLETFFGTVRRRPAASFAQFGHVGAARGGDGGHTLAVDTGASLERGEPSDRRGLGGVVVKAVAAVAEGLVALYESAAL